MNFVVKVHACGEAQHAVGVLKPKVQNLLRVDICMVLELHSFANDVVVRARFTEYRYRAICTRDRLPDAMNWKIWICVPITYALFSLWYFNWQGPLRQAEIDNFMTQFAENSGSEHTARLCAHI